MSEVIWKTNWHNSRTRKIGLLAEALYQGVDWLASMGAYGLIREIRDYMNGVLREQPELRK